jgi:hypothetical protein
VEAEGAIALGVVYMAAPDRKSGAMTLRPSTRVCFGIAAPAFLAFVALELTRKEPFVDLRLFTIFSFSMVSVVRFPHSTGLHTYVFLVALFVQ